MRCATSNPARPWGWEPDTPPRLSSARSASAASRCAAFRLRTASAELARSLGIEVVALDGKARLDVDIDGADEVDPRLNLVKGYGGAMVREKVVACASRKVVILVGAEKRVTRLGQRRRLPVEVVPFAAHYAMRRMRELGLKPAVRIGADGREFLSDNGNLVMDCGSRRDRSSRPPRTRVARDSRRGRHRTFHRYRQRRAGRQWRRFNHHARAPALAGGTSRGRLDG